MPTIAIVSPGFMGAALGWALRLGGARVVATAAGRSARTRRLAAEAGIELVPALADAVLDYAAVLARAGSAASNSTIVAAINHERTANGIPAVTENPVWSRRCRAGAGACTCSRRPRSRARSRRTSG